MKKIIVCLVVLFVVSSAANALVKLVIPEENVTVSEEHYSMVRGGGNLVNDTGMLGGDGLDALVFGGAGNYLDSWNSGGAALGVNQHPGAMALGIITSQWAEIDLGEVRTDLVTMGIWNGAETYWGHWFDVKDLQVLTSVDGVNYSVAATINNLLRSTSSSEDMPVGAVVDLTGIDAQYIMLSIAPGWDLVGGTPGDWERSYLWDITEYPNTYYTGTVLGEVRVYTPEPATMLLLGLGGLVLRRRK